MVAENIILFKRTRIPFFIRLIPAFVHPGVLILATLAGALTYFAAREVSSLAAGLYLVAIIVATLAGIVMYQLLRNRIQIITRIELAAGGLQIECMRYDTIQENIIPFNRLDLDLHRFQSRRQSVRYSLSISDTEHEQVRFILQESFEVLAKILYDIDQSRMVTLRAKETEAIRNWQSGKAWDKSMIGMIVRFAVPVLAIVVLGYQLLKIKDLGKFWSPNIQPDSTQLSESKQIAPGYSPARDSISSEANSIRLPFTLLGDSASFHYHTDQTGTHLISELFHGNSFYCTLPPHAGSALALSEITQVQAADINHDGKLDLIVRGEFLTGVGAEGGKSSEWISLYFQNATGQFLKSDSIDRAINRLQPVDRTLEKIVSIGRDQTFTRN